MPIYRSWTPGAVLKWAKSHYQNYGDVENSLYEHLHIFEDKSLESMNGERALKGLFAYLLATQNEGITKVLWKLVAKQKFNLRKNQLKELWIVSKPIEVLTEIFYEYHRLKNRTKKEHLERIDKGINAANVLRAIVNEEIGDSYVYPNDNQADFRKLTAYMHYQHWEKIHRFINRKAGGTIPFELDERDIIDLGYSVPSIDYVLFHLGTYLKTYLSKNPL